MKSKEKGQLFLIAAPSMVENPTFSFLRGNATWVIMIIGHFVVVYLVAKPLIWSEAECGLVVIETSI